MNVTLNGKSRVVAEGCSAAELVAELAPSPSGIAVAVDGEVLPHGSWDSALVEGSTVEVLTAVQGG